MILNRPYLNREEVSRLIQAADNPRDMLLIRFYAATGIRVTEGLEIEVDKHVDASMNRISIVHEKNRSRLKCPQCAKWVGKTHKFCPNCSHVLAADNLASETKIDRRVIVVDPQTIGLILGQTRKGKLFDFTRQRVDQIIKAAAKDIGIEALVDFYTLKRTQMHCHVLRHSFAMQWLNRYGRESIPELQRHLGHKNINTTYQYLHWMPDELAKHSGNVWGAG